MNSHHPHFIVIDSNRALVARNCDRFAYDDRRKSKIGMYERLTTPLTLPNFAGPSSSSSIQPKNAQH